MLQTAKAGRVPVDLAARFALDGSRVTLENLGGRPIRFAPAEAAGEAAPADLRAGFLLDPGKRETFRPAGGATFPLWVWGDSEVGIGPAIGPETGGGGGRTLGPATNTFGDDTTADRAAAEVLRDAYAGANAAWLAQYDADRTFLILLRWTGGGEVVQRRNLAGDDWEDVTDVIRGPNGTAGTNGAAGPGAIVTTSATYSAADDEIDLGLTVNPGIPSVLFWRVPADVDRKNAALDMVAHNIRAGLVDVASNAVVARQMTPGYLLSMVYFAGQFSLAEVLHPRPQDFDIVMAWVDAASNPALSAADVAAGDTFGTGRVTIPAYAGSETFAYMFVGVPAVAPDIDIQNVRRVDAAGQLSLARAADATEAGGAAYKWWHTPQRVRVTTAGREYDVAFNPY